MWFWKFPKSDVIRSLHTWPWSPAIGKPGDCMVKRRVEGFGQSIWGFSFIDSWWHRHHCCDEVYVCVCVSRVWIFGCFFGVEPSFWLTHCGGEICFNLLPFLRLQFCKGDVSARLQKLRIMRGTCLGLVRRLCGGFNLWKNTFHVYRVYGFFPVWRTIMLRMGWIHPQKV